LNSLYPRSNSGKSIDNEKSRLKEEPFLEMGQHWTRVAGRNKKRLFLAEISCKEEYTYREN
jgi:hypothetical protein